MADNVTPISSARPPGPPAKPRRRRKSKIGVEFAEQEDDAGFCTLDVVLGLHGVCCALDTASVNGEHDDVARLVLAARILSTLMHKSLA